MDFEHAPRLKLFSLVGSSDIVYLYIHTYIHTHISIQTEMPVCMYACMYVCIMGLHNMCRIQQIVWHTGASGYHGAGVPYLNMCLDLLLKRTFKTEIL